METNEKTENKETPLVITPVKRIVNDKSDFKAIYEFNSSINAKILEFTVLKVDLLSIRESKNLSVRETQKVLTTLCKTINALSEYSGYLQIGAYNTEHAVEIFSEKRELRELIKNATPNEMAEFREFLKAKEPKTEV